MGGSFIGFWRYLGNCTVTKTKLWGILDGLKLILDRRFEKISIQMDSLEAVNTIQKGSSRNSNSALVRRIHHIQKMAKQWKFHHIPWEENIIAYNLVNMVHNRNLGLRLFEDPPLE
ncbi:hypothetical protein Godav_013348, partial [Gossypium davidsonii]|nr:hypothetical protein [Gossypium davidsonii]